MPNDKTLLIRQPAGLGDIFFCLKIAETYAQIKGCDRVIWPVVNQYSYIGDYIHTNCHVEFPDEDSEFPFKHEIYRAGHRSVVETDECIFLPLQSADVTIPNCRCHSNRLCHGHTKYDLAEMTNQYWDWKNYFNIKRNYDREQALVERLGVDLSKPYNVVNRNYGTWPNYLTREDIQTSNDGQEVQMTFLEGTHIFDWMTILENAQEIHTIETSLWYIIEKMGLQNVTVYSKFPDFQHDMLYIRGQCSENWKLVI